MEIICGINAVYEAIRAGKRKITSLYIADGKINGSVGKIVELCGKAGIKIKTVSKQKIFELAKVETNQGIVAEIEPFKYALLEDLVVSNKPHFLIILDQVSDPHNFGAIIRTAHLTSATGIIIPKDNSALVGPTVAKSASGALEYLPIAKVTNLNSAIKTLQANNIWVVGADGDAAKTIYGYDFKAPCAIVLGGEGKGLRRLVKENCDELLSIPMFGKTGSYNVSVAGAIVMAEVMRQRGFAKLDKTAL